MTRRRAREREVAPLDVADLDRHSDDPHDDYLVALAKAVRAVLVSSDCDVLEADTGHLEVRNACEFLDRLA